jgi:hypothetical protein
MFKIIDFILHCVIIIAFHKYRVNQQGIHICITLSPQTDHSVQEFIDMNLQIRYLIVMKILGWIFITKGCKGTPT